MNIKTLSESEKRFILWTRSDYSGGWQPDSFDTFEAAAAAQKEKLISGVYVDTVVTELIPVVFMDGREPTGEKKS